MPLFERPTPTHAVHEEIARLHLAQQWRRNAFEETPLPGTRRNIAQASRLCTTQGKRRVGVSAAAIRVAEVTPELCEVKVCRYCSRWNFLLTKCAGKTVFHLGCIGETDGTLEDKVRAFLTGRALHPNLMKVASEVVGIDLNKEAVQCVGNAAGTDNLFVGDVEHLEQVNLDRTFDVIIFGDLIEHLSCPGLALNGLRRFMSAESELVISTPNAFSLPANIRFSLGRHSEGAEHVAGYSRFTLQNVLARHGFRVTEFLTCFDRPASSRTGRTKIAGGSFLFRLMPERGGTLMAVCQKR
jgi:hypothetical protein